jgi:magnesium chelatase subunit D
VRPVLPPGILEALDGGLGRSAGGRGAGKVQNGSRRGRPFGTRRGDARRGERLNILETLRAAAPWQRLRRDLSPDRRGLHIRKQDFRVYRCKKRSESTAVFLVDASGSAAFQRLAEAKGAVEIILADCYVRRDKVALIAFRGRCADTLLPPTRSLQRARRSLAALPGGGGTPLAAGLDAGALIADKVRRSGGVPLLVLLTDGRANIARDGQADRACAMADAEGSARAIRLAGYRSMVIDVSARPDDAARQVARWLGANYLPLPMADAGRISQPVAAAMRAGAGAA